MGLDISAMNNLQKKTYSEDTGMSLEEWKDEQELCIWKNPHWEHHFGTLEEGSYEADYCKVSFRRSYSGWGHVRERLAELAGWPEWTGGTPWDYYNSRRFPRQEYGWLSGKGDLPLQALICFSDCEGFICNEVCKTISGDFDKIIVDEDLQPLKDMFKWCVENNGIIQFH